MPEDRIELSTPGLLDQCSSHWATRACFFQILWKISFLTVVWNTFSFISVCIYIRLLTTAVNNHLHKNNLVDIVTAGWIWDTTCEFISKYQRICVTFFMHDDSSSHKTLGVDFSILITYVYTTWYSFHESKSRGFVTVFNLVHDFIQFNVRMVLINRNRWPWTADWYLTTDRRTIRPLFHYDKVQWWYKWAEAALNVPNKQPICIQKTI